MENTIIVLRKRSKALSPILQIGKKGITDESVKELKKLLNRHKLVKVKLLRSALSHTNMKEAVARLVEKTGASLIDQTGFTAVLYFKKV